MKPIYRAKDGWVLCFCSQCGRTNYVEPHGITARCRCTPGEETVHQNIPYELRNPMGAVYLGKKVRRG